MIRRGHVDDLPELMEIYNEAVRNSVATFDMVEKDMADRQKWFEDHERDPYLLLVEEIDGKAVAYATLSQYRERAAFDPTVEISIYIDSEHRGMGIGKRLMKETLDFAKDNPKIHSVISLISAGNEISEKLHEQFGFAYCGVMNQIGYKKDQWLGLKIFQLMV